MTIAANELQPAAPKFRMEAAPDLPLWRETFAGLDWLSLRLSPTYRGHGVTRGDGSPVIVVPGLFASDACLRELHGWLKRIGYDAHYSDIGRNVDCPRVMVERLLHTIERVHAQTGRRIRLVGHSLGGLIARGAALKRPDLVSQVITVGTPVNGIRAHPLVLAAARHTGGDCADNCLAWTQEPLSPSVAETSIYSPTDGVVDPMTSIPAGDTGSVAVGGTHAGLIVNPQVFAALGDLLSAYQPAATRPKLRLIHGTGTGQRQSHTSVPDLNLVA